MASRLHQVLTFPNVAPAGQLTIAHNINWNGRAVIPDRILPMQGNGAFTVIAVTTTAMTIQNDEAAPASFVFWLESLHSHLRAFSDVNTKFLTPLPFVTGGGGGGSAPASSSNIVVWHDGDAWTDVYAEIEAIRTASGAAFGPIICYVEPAAFGGPTIPATMTPGAYNINDVQFISIITSLGGGSSGSDFVVIVVEDGVTFDSFSNPNPTVAISSINIRWLFDCTTTPVVDDPTVDVNVSLIGQSANFLFGFECTAFAGGLVFNCNNFVASMVGSQLNGSFFGTGMIVAAGAENVRMTGTSQIGILVFDDGTNVTVQQDSTSILSDSACAANNDLVTVTLLDAAARVTYDDGLSSGVGSVGSLQSTQVQEAVDALKFMSAPERRNTGWAAGLGTTITAIDHWGWFVPTLGSGTIGNASATDGTAVATGNLRKRFTSAAGANNAAELLQGSTFLGFYISALVGFGGFKAMMRFVPGITNPANKRGFYGFTDSGSALAATTQPSALTNNFGFAFDAAETTFRFQHNDAAGASTRIDLGANFPTRDATVMYTIMLWCEPNTAAVNWWIKNETAQLIESGVATTNLPAAGVGLAPHMHQNNGGTASATEWDFAYANFYLP